MANPFLGFTLLNNSDNVPPPIEDDNGIIVGVAAFGSFRSEPAGDGILWELSGPRDFKEDKRVTLTSPGLGPVFELASVEDESTVTNIDGVSCDVEGSSGEVSEGHNIRISTVPFVGVWSGNVTIIDLDGIPLDRNMNICEGLERSPEFRAHPGAAAQPRPVGPATDDSKRLALSCAGLEAVIVCGQRLPEEFCVNLGKVGGVVLLHKCGHPDMCVESR